MSSEGRGKPVLPPVQRQIIKYCIDNAKEDLGERIYRRVMDKRDDFRSFVESLPKVSYFTIKNDNISNYKEHVVVVAFAAAA